MSDPNVTAAFLWLWENRFTEQDRDRWRAAIRDLAAALERMAPALEAWQQAGIEEAEQHANKGEL